MKKPIKHISKDKLYKTTDMAVNELIRIYDIWLSQKKYPTSVNKTYHITVGETKAKHESDLHFILTNNLFNRINREIRNTLEHLNYIFVIEYPEIISQGFLIPTNCNVHAHIVLNTSLNKETLEYYLHSTFGNDSHIKVDDTTKRNDKGEFINYLLKQTKENKLLTDRSYNFKITMY
jgi:hypothetical protein